MSALNYNFIRESICATCLSQNGQLIAVRDSQACILSYSELHLKRTDRICWLCHDFVQRMVAFKIRAQRAQAWLQNMAQEQQNKLAPPLTNVVMTDEPYVTATDPLIVPDIKPEPDTISQWFHNHNKASSNHLHPVPHIPQQTHSNISPVSINSVLMEPEADDTENTSYHQNMACYQLQRNQNRLSGTPETLNHKASPNRLQNISVPHILQQTHSAIIPGCINSVMTKHEAEDTENMSNHQNQNRVATPETSYSPILMKFETDENNDNCNDEDLSPCKLQQSHCGDFARPVVAMPLMNPKTESNYNDNVEAYGNMQQNTGSTSYQMENNPAVTAKPLEIIKPRVENNIGVIEVARERNTNSVDISVFTHQKVKTAGAIKNKTPDTAQPDYIYTEKILTEGEMTQWRRIKPHTEFYTHEVAKERCEKCIEPFDYHVACRAHANSHTEAFGKLVCNICQQRTMDKPAMDMHRKWHYRLLKCRYCPFVWDDVNTMRRHCRDMHSIPQVLWDCDRCERQFPSLQVWRRHSRNHKVRKTAECPVCGLVLDAFNLKTHVKHHTGEIPLKTCEDCGKEYRGEASLRRHMRSHRTEVDETAFCAECNIQFRSQISYRSHLKCGKHLGKEQFRFECHDCGKKFPTRGQIRAHVDIHSDTKYPCEKCRKVFTTRDCRARHMRLVHEHRAKREYICDQCGKVYTMKLHLLEHINKHTGARPYVCKLCGDTFGYKSALYLHGRFRHKIQKKNNDKKKIDDKKQINDKKIDDKKKINDKKKMKATKTKHKKVSESK